MRWLALTLILVVVFLQTNNATISIYINLFLCLEFYSKFKSTSLAIFYIIVIDWPAVYSTRASGFYTNSQTDV